MALATPALGRPFSLGMLYDCRSDALIPGITLWKREALEKDVSVQPQNNTSFEVLASDTISDKSSALSLGLSLKASFLFGLVEVGGSGKFLRDMKSSTKQARVTLHYSRTTRFEQLSMNHLSMENMSYHNVFSKVTATHVVTGILYGAQAFFIFDQEVSPVESVQDVKGNLQAMIRRIPQGLGLDQAKSQEKRTAHTFSCQFHGDFALERNPVNYEDAIKIYGSLPQALGSRGEKAVPVTVWLYPLNKLDSKAAQLVREIRETLVFRAEGVLEQMAEVDMLCNDLMRHPVALTFPEVTRKIHQFGSHCQQFTLMLQKQLAQALPSVRGGSLDEEAIEAIFTRKEQSPFRQIHIKDFLNRKQQELDVIGSYLKGLANVAVVPTENELRRVLADQDAEYTVSFNFSSLGASEQYLSDVAYWLQTNKYHSEEMYRAPNSLPWFQEKGLARKARQYVREFQAFAAVNLCSREMKFVVASVADAGSPGVSIHLYEGGDLVNAKFEPPAQPHVPLVTVETTDTVALTPQAADFGKDSIEGYRVQYKPTGGDAWLCRNTEKKEAKITITGLKANSRYQFRYSAVCRAGLSTPSEVTAPVRTLPTTPPGTPDITAEPQAITVFWGAPLLVGEGATISQYRVEYKEESKGTWLQKRTGSNTNSCVIEGLSASTKYRVRVTAECGDSGESRASDEAQAVTPADKPAKAAQQMVRASTLLMAGHPSIYQIQPDYSQFGYHQYTLGKENPRKMNKVILLVGTPGSGKATVIDGMANYIFGVEWQDGFRLKLTHRHPSQVTVYKIHYDSAYELTHSLTVIDTPTLGATDGVGLVTRVTEAIHVFLTTARDIGHIDAICFVVRAPSAQLTATQRLLFHSVCSMFGKDLKDNIMLLTTHADGQKPPVVGAIKAHNIPCAVDSDGDLLHFKLNNSSLFATNKSRTAPLSKLFWSIGKESLAVFFRYLRTTEPKSLELTQKVLKSRKELDMELQELLSELQVGLMKQEEMVETQRLLQEAHATIEANQDYEYDEETQEETLVPLDEVLLNCPRCDHVCHFPCTCAITDTDVSKCSAMDKKGFCTSCPNRCHSGAHFIQKFATGYVRRTQRATNWQKKEAYYRARAEAESLLERQRIIEGCSMGGTPQLTHKCTQELTLLRELSLRPNPLLSTQHIELLIEAELEEAGTGHRERVTALIEAKRTAEMVERNETDAAERH
uniref:Fibronectin type-III domain-containing protein n=1 Tax=Xenopus tropicalis TaxID=8364 RepID=F6UW48_XENTR